MIKKGAQGSLEYIILVGGIIILATATYFMLKGFTQSTGADTSETLVTAGDKFRLEIKNMGRSETRFLARKWLNLSLTKLTEQKFDVLGNVVYSLSNLSDHGIDTDTLQFACFNESFCTLNYTIGAGSLTVQTADSCCADENFTLYMFYNNSSPLIDPCLANYAGPTMLSCETYLFPDTEPPYIIISSTAYGSEGSVEDALIEVVVEGTGSKVAEVYYKIDDTLWFPVDNIYYRQGTIMVEAHPKDNSYNSNAELIHITVTVPSEDNYTVKVWAFDEHGNEKLETQEVNITIGSRPPDATAPTIFKTEPLNNTLLTVSQLTINLTTNEFANCRFSNESGTSYSSMTSFNYTGSLRHNLTGLLLQDGQNYKYYFRCNDTSGNANESDHLLNFTKADTNPPLILSTEPVNNSLVYDSPITINITTNEIAHCRFSNETGTPYSSMTNFNNTDALEHNLTNISLDDWANYTYYIKCNDTWGNVNETDYILNFTKLDLDLIPPAILTAQPANNSQVGDSPITINITTNEIAHCRFSNESGTSYSSMTDFNNTDALTHNITNVSVSLGQNFTFYFKCNDTDGNVNTTDYILNFTGADLNPPAVLSTQPANITIVSDTPITINVTTNEIAHCRYSASSGTPYTSMTDFDITDSTGHNITGVSLTDGKHYEYYFKCNDTWGNVNPSDYGFRFTKSGPAIQILTFNIDPPSPGPSCGMDIDFSVNADRDIYWCWLRVNSTGNYGSKYENRVYMNTSGQDANFTIFFDLGNHTANVNCTDYEGNVDYANLDFETPGDCPSNGGCSYSTNYTDSYNMTPISPTATSKLDFEVNYPNNDGGYYGICDLKVNRTASDVFVEIQMLDEGMYHFLNQQGPFPSGSYSAIAHCYFYFCVPESYNTTEFTIP